MRSPIRYLLAPTSLCLVLSAAHFIHAHQHIYATLCIMGFISLMIRHPICLRLNQVAMVLLSAEWLHSLIEGYQERTTDEQAWPQMALLMVLVAIVHLSCAILLQHHRIRHYFGYPRQYIFR
ncbi:hypothetical protein [Agarivorans sp.]|uniref:hypothetical protein n=1 Tax=Agarivorans sp. TaxID=1872412 RepID=UPI003D07B8BD